jgi:hypothetical protein
MAFISTALAAIIANWAVIIGVIGSLLGLGAVIAKLTPSPKDDRFFAACLRFFKLVPVAAPGSDVAPRAGNPTSDGSEPPIMG